MIIQCVKCNKQFEVNSSLIPDNGRNLKCGSCGHTWFYEQNQNDTVQNLSKLNAEQTIKENTVEPNKQKEKDLISNNNLQKTENVKKSSKNNVSNNISLGKILSYFIVSIISFIALIIILDTFKSPLNKIFPNLEFLLYNLFETIKDVILFVKNLLA
jgi:predicted Zn finger-like uncharacterized protein